MSLRGVLPLPVACDLEVIVQAVGSFCVARSQVIWKSEAICLRRKNAGQTPEAFPSRPKLTGFPFLRAGGLTGHFSEEGHFASSPLPLLLPPCVTDVGTRPLFLELGFCERGRARLPAPEVVVSRLAPQSRVAGWHGHSRVWWLRREGWGQPVRGKWRI